jgi:purine-nucleoside phosphorylase
LARTNPKKTDSSIFKDIATGVVLGSGLFGVSDDFPTEAVLPFEDIEGLGSPGVPGHTGEFRRCVVAGRSCLFVCGRKHYYEGGTRAIESLLEFVCRSGVRRLLLTSAAGSLVKSVCPGELVLVDDVLDLQFRRRARARDGNGVESVARPGSKRPLALDAALLRDVWTAAATVRVRLGRGAAITCAGPLYESPAEIRAMQQTGATLVTMSGAPEIAIANATGIRVAMIGFVTNWASGISGTRLHHDDVLEMAGTGVSKLRQLVEKFVEQGPQNMAGREADN